MTQSVRGNFVNLGDVAAELGSHRGYDAQDVVGTAARSLTCVQCGRGGGVGTPSSRAASIIHFASPDSLATGGMDWSVGSDLNAMASRSSSQDCTTEPSRHELITAAGSLMRSDFTIVAKPSPNACIMPYSMPLCTILAKWPPPTGPASTSPESPSGLSASKIGRARSKSSSLPPTMSAYPTRRRKHRNP